MASGGMRINLPNLVLEMREILVRVAGEREMAPKCGSLPRDAGDLVGLKISVPIIHVVLSLKQ